MKEKILTELRKAGDGYVSGTALCSLLSISRQAVWKNIAALKENGYQVESVASKGYRLLSEPDKMYGPDILSRIDKDCLCKQVESFECIDSTNTKVKQLAEAGAKEGLLVVAEEQTGGKGRRGRVWEVRAGYRNLDVPVTSPDASDRADFRSDFVSGTCNRRSSRKVV